VAIDRGDTARASSLFERALAVAKKSGNTAVIPSILIGLAVISSESNDFERAQRLWVEALTFAREQGNAFAAASALMLLGYAELAQGNRGRATTLLREALVLYRELDRCQDKRGTLPEGPGNRRDLPGRPPARRVAARKEPGDLPEVG
jgi:tetratricopeptide (TPR) repeat protein